MTKNQKEKLRKIRDDIAEALKTMENNKEELHDIIIDLRKALMEDNDNIRIRADVSKQIARLYNLMQVM